MMVIGIDLGQLEATGTRDATTFLRGDATWAVPSGGGGGGGSSSIKDRRWTAGSDETSIDEFNDDDLDAAWTRVDTSGHDGNVEWAEGGDVLSVSVGLGTDASAELHGMVRPLSGAGGSMADGDAFLTCTTRLRNGSLTIAGIVLADGTTVGSGNQLLAESGSGASTAMIPERRIFTNWNAQASNATSGINILGGTIYLRVAKISGTTWRMDYSPDGILWVKDSTFTTSITPTHVGFAVSSWGTATKNVVSFEFLRRVSGIT